MSKDIRPSCPNCDSTSVIPVMYGLPDKKLMKMHENGKIHHHGCVLSENMPEWHCKACGHEWGNIEV